jgi:uncharacterized protein DUF4411
VTILYCLDSGVFINSWTKHYPPEVFPAVWDHLDKLCQAGTVFVPDEVAKEVAAGDDGASKWLKARKKVIVKPNENIILQMQQIVSLYPRLTAEGSRRSAADPWVIAFALIKHAILVTEEQPSGNVNKPKIPDVCLHIDLKYTNTIGLLKATGFKV